MSIKIIKMFLLGLFVVIIFSVFRPRASSVPTVRITRQSNCSTVSHLGHTSNWPGKLALIADHSLIRLPERESLRLKSVDRRLQDIYARFVKTHFINKTRIIQFEQIMKISCSLLTIEESNMRIL